jgi:hypothetical protein
MDDQSSEYRPGILYVDTSDPTLSNPTLSNPRPPQKRSGISDRSAVRSEDTVPLFLSDPLSEPDPSEFITPRPRIRSSFISPRLLVCVFGAAAVAMVFAMLPSDATKNVMAYIGASTAAVFPASSVAAQSSLASKTGGGVQPKDRAALAAPANQASAVQVAMRPAAEPTREEITSAFRNAQNALPNGVAVVAAVAEPAHPAETIHRLDPDDIAASLKRADALIASGDLAAARLVLRGAADAGDAHAAMTLGGTYDPAILVKLGVHGFAPDIALARDWYEKARSYGATDAAQRLQILATAQH